jgi:toxin ParE1/3/4
MTLLVTKRATAQLAAISEFIARENPLAARRVGELIRSAFDLLCEFPEMGRAGRETGTREWVVRGLPYIVVYSIVESSLVIIGVYHGARNVLDK